MVRRIPGKVKEALPFACRKAQLELLLRGAPACNVETEAGTRDVHGAEKPAVGAENRNRHARQTVLELVDDHGVALPADALELALKLARIGDRRRRSSLERPREDVPKSRRVERGENDLAARACVQRVALPDPIDRLITCGASICSTTSSASRPRSTLSVTVSRVSSATRLSGLRDTTERWHEPGSVRACV